MADTVAAAGFDTTTWTASASSIIRVDLYGKDCSYDIHIKIPINGSAISDFSNLFNVTDNQSLITLSTIMTQAGLEDYSSNDSLVLVYASMIVCNINDYIYCDFGNNAPNIEVFTQQTNLFQTFLPN